ncbi:hypothetical protein HYW21_03105 [Candidatus Woesearchaeota archaeon]|nr:hypothetical protein [Candidatus Woesearchaeota archaeon]
MTWEKLVEREGDFLKNYLLYENYVEDFPQVHNRHHSNFLTIRRGNTFAHFVQKQSGKEFSKFLKDKIAQNPQFMSKILERGKFHFENLVHFSEEIAKRDLDRLSNRELKELLEGYFRRYKAPYPYFNITIFTDGLEEKKKTIDRMADLRFLGRSSFNKTHELIEPVFEEIGKRFDVSTDEVKFLKPIEIIHLLDGDELDVKSLISNRQNCYFLLQEGKFFLKENESYVINEEASNELTGRGTFPASYTGKVKVVRTIEDIEKMNDGDIIVSRMTTPDLIVEGVKRAGAIVTDEGGVTCHAAVLSRELKIPVLLGTGNATKLLNDGDLIEVDTDKGTVTKLKPKP